MKKLFTFGVMLVAALSLAACGNSSGSKDSSTTEKATKVDKTSASKVSSKSSSKKTANQAIPTTADKDWFFNAEKNVFYAGNETMTLTKSEVRDGAETGSKLLVIYNTIRNNSDEEQDPSNFYMVIHAKQKTDTSNVTLDPGVMGVDDQGNDPLQAQEDNLNNSLLPGKTVETVIMFKLENTNPVTVEFSNADFEKIGTKTYDVK